MRFEETPLKGAFVVHPDPRSDDRGFFTRAFCAKEFEEHGLNPTIAQTNISVCREKGTLRGLHYQLPPDAEAKFLRCISGAVWDVIVDMRPDSPTYLKYFGVELTDSNRLAIYIPEMFAHCYLALTDGAEVIYSTTAFYAPGAERGLRYDDPAIGIEWPIKVTNVSQKDAAWPLLDN